MSMEELLDMIQTVRKNSCFKFIMSVIIWIIIIGVVMMAYFVIFG